MLYLGQPQAPQLDNSGAQAGVNVQNGNEGAITLQITSFASHTVILKEADVARQPRQHHTNRLSQVMSLACDYCHRVYLHPRICSDMLDA